MKLMIMKRLSILILFALLATAILATAALATPTREPHRYVPPAPAYQPLEAMASVDSVTLIGPWGSGAVCNGQFQDQGGAAAWNGWTHRDLTQPLATHWHLSDYLADNLPGGHGNIAAWCGEADFAPCEELDPKGGYGNDWSEALEWRGKVNDPAAGVTINVTAVANFDCETGFDFTRLTVMTAAGFEQVASYSGQQQALAIDENFTLDPEDYQGDDGDEVVIRFHFQSDGGWSDEDCHWPSGGAAQIDDIGVLLDQGRGPQYDFTDFESGWGNWTPLLAPGVGDFAQIWTDLEDVDPCNTNYSPQVAFIDDGLVVPGVGPSICQDWCYGPSGFIVNPDGGALGPGNTIRNVVESPVLSWPSAQMSGAILAMDVYQHESLDSDSPWLFWTWSVRSTASTDPADLEAAEWLDRNLLHLGGPEYVRFREDVSDLLVPGASLVQVQLGVYQVSAWTPPGMDGTPAPYFDNVRLTCFERRGPQMAVLEKDLAQDGFPAAGVLNQEDWSANSVRFDAARNISFGEGVTPGDSLVVSIKTLRPGAALTGPPVMVVALQPHDLFDPYRQLPAGFALAGDLIMGEVEGVPASHLGVIDPEMWAFDLPDSGFFFPGDVIQYYFRATDDDGSGPQTATLPASPPGSIVPRSFGLMDVPYSCDGAFDSRFTVRALPTLVDSPYVPGQMMTHEILIWLDNGELGGLDGWHDILANMCFFDGYDVFTTRCPEEGEGNGLGSRATPAILDLYDVIIYTSGDLARHTLAGDSESSSADLGQDVALLDAWLRLGGKGLFLTGDNLVSDLAGNQGPAGDQFLADWMGVDLVAPNVAPIINSQIAPGVLQMAMNSVYRMPWGDEAWVADGGCPSYNTFDAVIADEAGGAERLLEFANPAGGAGSYDFAAGTRKDSVEFGSTVISLPYDLAFIRSADHPSVHFRVLEASWEALGLGYVYLDTPCNSCGEVAGAPDPGPVPGAAAFSLSCFPNPFNPATSIRYTMPGAGHLKLQIFNLRGELVKTLVDRRVQGSGVAVWDGTDLRGAQVGSGVYFSRAVAAGQVRVEKMALIK